MIQVNYVPRILKGRDRAIVKSFVSRLSNPFILFVWFYVALQIKHYELYVLFVFSSLGSIYHVYQSYSDFVFDITYMEHTEIGWIYKITLWTRDFFVQFLCCLLAFWWSLRPLNMDPIHQGYVWMLIFVFTLLLHVVHAKQTQKMSEKIIKEVYSHV